MMQQPLQLDPGRKVSIVRLVPSLIVLVVGCAGTRQQAVMQHAPGGCPPQAIVMVVDGAGGGQHTTSAFRNAINEAGLPWRVERLQWTHGSRRYFADHTDQVNTARAGECLALTILHYRQTYPNATLYVVGHSAGTAVVVEGMMRLPPDTVDQVLLLAPTVSATYDIRPTLRAARGGVDVFCSRRDMVNVGVAMIGTADRRWFEGVAGREGFTGAPACPGDAALYLRLRHHPWSPEQSRIGHNGGHYGSYDGTFLKMVVLPMMASHLRAVPVCTARPFANEADIGVSNRSRSK